MKLKSLVVACALIACSTTYAQNNLFANSRFGVQGAMSTGGDLSIGVVNYSDRVEMGLTASGSFTNHDSQSISPAVFLGLRNALAENTFFAYGLNANATFGKVSNTDTRNYSAGPYISLEQALTQHLLLSGWIDVYSYQYQKVAGVSNTTNNFFNTGGVALSYLF